MCVKDGFQEYHLIFTVLQCDHSSLSYDSHNVIVCFPEPSNWGDKNLACNGPFPQSLNFPGLTPWRLMPQVMCVDLGEDATPVFPWPNKCL